MTATPVNRYSLETSTVLKDPSQVKVYRLVQPEQLVAVIASHPGALGLDDGMDYDVGGLVYSMTQSGSASRNLLNVISDTQVSLI